jgi:DNA polymerase-3 subunit epsilon
MKAIYFDTETTGINKDKDKIIEIAAFDATNERTFVSFINPGFPIPPEATAIHHITDDLVADAPGFREVAEKFTEFCGDDAVLIAHNGDSFDIPFLAAESAKVDFTFPKWRALDTLKWARKYRPDLPRHSLQYLREVYGIAPNQAHRALDDVMMLYTIFSKMTDDLPLEIIIELLSHKSKLTHMPFGKHQGKPLADIPKDYLKWLAGSGAFDKDENQELKKQLEELKLLKVN